MVKACRLHSLSLRLNCCLQLPLCREEGHSRCSTSPRARLFSPGGAGIARSRPYSIISSRNYAATGLERYLRLAECGFAWFTGRNSRGTVMAHGGGCCDGLEAFAVNPNMGAESTLAYLASAFAVSQESARPALFAR